MNKEEVNKFLESKLLLQIGTIDQEGDPDVHPVWFGYDIDREKLLVITPKITKKVKNPKRQRHCQNDENPKKTVTYRGGNIYEISWHT